MSITLNGKPIKNKLLATGLIGGFVAVWVTLFFGAFLVPFLTAWWVQVLLEKGAFGQIYHLSYWLVFLPMLAISVILSSLGKKISHFFWATIWIACIIGEVITRL